MSLQIVIRDPSDKEMYELEVNIATGEAQFVTSPPEYNYDIDDSIVPQETRELLPTILHERQVAMPTEGFRMKIQPLTDLVWRNQFGDQSEAKLQAVFEHAKTFFQHPTLQTKFELDVLPTHDYPGRMDNHLIDKTNMQ